MREHIFYRGSEPALLLCEKNSFTVVRGLDRALFVAVQAAHQVHGELVACDLPGTALLLSTQASVKRLSYSPYGHHCMPSGDAGLTGFNGERCFDILGGYFLGQGRRLFSTGLMRFISADTQSPFLAGGINCYAYCGDNPVCWRDPSGQMKTLNPLRTDPPTPSPRRIYAQPPVAAPRRNHTQPPVTALATERSQESASGSAGSNSVASVPDHMTPTVRGDEGTNSALVSRLPSRKDLRMLQALLKDIGTDINAGLSQEEMRAELEFADAIFKKLVPDPSWSLAFRGKAIRSGKT